MRRGLIALLLVLWAVPAGAANHYVRAGASGTGSGADWTNACPDFTGSCAVASLVRGDIYYVAGGSYASRDFTTAESGTSVLTILGATVAAHGTETGWSDAYSVALTPATFAWGTTWAVLIGTSYITFDGAVGSDGDAAAYGFVLAQPASCSTAQEGYLHVAKVGGTLTNGVVRHVAVTACGSGSDVTQFAFVAGCGSCYVTGSTFAYLYVDGGQKAMSITNLANSTIEYLWSQNQWSSDAHHGETISVNNCHNSDVGGCSTAFTQGQGTVNTTLRYSVLKNCRGTACLAAIDPGYEAAITGWHIYGNVFVDATAGNGTIATGTSATHYIKDTKVYNNTFVDCPAFLFYPCGATTPCAAATGNEFKNNLAYNSVSTVTGSSGTVDHDYNAWFAATDTPPTEANGQISAINPFTNYAGGIYLLAGATTAGLTLSSPYNTDRIGTTRGADATWDRGAYEYGVPSAPTNVRIR